MISQPASNFCRWILVSFVLTAASACSTQPVSQPDYKSSQHRAGSAAPVVRSDDRHGARAAEIALDQLGTPYRYGGNAPSGFDCSGLVQYSYARAGKSVPRTTSALWNDARPVQGDSLRVGDVLFFNIAGKMSHVGLYVGDGRFVHAPSSGKVVSIESLSSNYYSRAFIRAGRL